MTKLSPTERFSSWVVNHPWLAIVSTVFTVFFISMGAQYLQFNTNYRVFFANGNPQLETFDKLEKTYSKVDNVVFTIRPAEGTVFQPDVLALTQELTEDSWKLPYAQRVDSLTNFQHTYAEGDNLTVIDLVENNPYQLSSQDLDGLKTIALSEPLLLGRTISSDAKTTGVNVTFNLTRKDPFEVPKATAQVRKLLTKYHEKYPNIEIRPSGTMMLNNAFMESSMQDMQFIVPIMYLILLATMFIFLRSFSATFAITLVIIFSAASAMGFGGWIGFPMTPPTATVPTIVLTLAIADSIHIIVSMFRAMQKQAMDKKAAIIESLRINIQPVFLTSLTTIIGFLSLNFSDAPPFWHLGNMTAFGIGAAFVYSIFFLPALLMILPIRCKKNPKEKTTQKDTMDKFADFVIRKRAFLLIACIVSFTAIGSMVSKIELNDQFVQYFDESVSFRPDSEFMMKHLTGIYTLEFSLPAKQQYTISDTEYLTHLTSLTEWLRKQPEVYNVYSMSDIFKRLNKNMHGDNESWYKTPDSNALAAQYLLLYEMSLPYGLDLNDRINIDKTASRISITISDMSTNELRAFKGRVEGWIVDNTPSYMHTKATSPVIMFAYISERNINSMIKGNLISILLISLCIMVALRNVKIGLISLIPNLTPVFIGYGLWGLFVGEINMAVAIASAVSLGIIVDDTVHFLSKYQRARNEKGYNSHDAIRYAFSTVGTALVLTTVILTFGFSALGQSAFQLNSYLGLLTALVVVSALVADFFLLPPLLIFIEERFNRKKETNTMKKTLPLLLIGYIIISSSYAHAEKNKDTLLSSGTPQEIGYAIALELDERDTGFKDQSATLTMTLRNAYGEEHSRSMRNKTLENPDLNTGDKSIIIFDNPRDLKGTALLSHAQILDPDNQWLYLPALKRVKRISSKNKSGPFLGSEVSYEDITANEIGKYNWTHLKLDPCGDLECFLLETTPKYKYSGYTRRLVWVDTEAFRLQKIEFYDRKNELLKTQTFHGYKQYLNKFWRADKWSTVNHQTNKSTDLNFNKYLFKTGLKDKDFTKAVLKRIK